MRQLCHQRVLSLLVCGVASVAACTSSSTAVSSGTRTGLTLAIPSRSRFVAEPPVSLGQRSIGVASRRAAALSVTDSIVRYWGWQVATVDPRRTALRTEWLYLTGPDFSPGAGRQCEDGAVVGLRLEIAPRDTAKHRGEFLVRGEARVVAQANRSAAERLARQGLGTISKALQDGIRAAALRPDTLTASVARASGEIGILEGAQRYGCATVRP
jgi:hypothetical protein